MNTEKVLDIIASTVNGMWPIISTTGLISRCLYERHDSSNQFYIPGSMGLASSVALGISLNKPTLPVVAIDGDGSLLMNLGTLATIASNCTKNFIHIVLDNGIYDSCSGEATLASKVSLVSLAKAAGYRVAKSITSPHNLIELLKKSPGLGPTLIHVPVVSRARRDYIRPINLEDIKFRFLSFLGHSMGSHAFSSEQELKVNRIIELLLKGTPFKEIDELTFKKRMSWYYLNRNSIHLQGNLPQRAFDLFFKEYASVEPGSVDIIFKDSKKIIWRSKNFCPYLEACLRLGIDTRVFCHIAHESCMDNFVKILDHRLHFNRSYTLIRPHAPFCEESITLT